MTDPFLTHRGLLFTIAYEMLGSAVDAEDAVQESWLKWKDIDQNEIHDSRAYLIRIVTRKALDHIRTLARRREQYVGPWLPEPLLTSPDVADDVELADSLSTAMLLVLETLTPTQRAVFVLHEVFDVGYDELAKAIGKTEPAVRQIAHRARLHVGERRPRGIVSRVDTLTALAAFRRALVDGDIQALADTLAPDVVALGDGGGIKRALPRPVVGADKVSRLLTAGMATVGNAATLELVEMNGWPALLLRIDGQVDGVVSVRVGDGLITGLYTVRNPEKLARIMEHTALTRGQVT